MGCHPFTLVYTGHSSPALGAFSSLAHCLYMFPWRQTPVPWQVLSPPPDVVSYCRHMYVDSLIYLNRIKRSKSVLFLIIKSVRNSNILLNKSLQRKLRKSDWFMGLARARLDTTDIPKKLGKYLKWQNAFPKKRWLINKIEHSTRQT